MCIPHCDTVTGGAGEGKQHLKPGGTQKNTQEVKSDETLPFYCHPPNPCPKGHKGNIGTQQKVVKHKNGN